jgi:hypothetical protein
VICGKSGVNQQFFDLMRQDAWRARNESQLCTRGRTKELFIKFWRSGEYCLASNGLPNSMITIEYIGNFDSVVNVAHKDEAVDVAARFETAKVNSNGANIKAGIDFRFIIYSNGNLANIL